MYLVLQLLQRHLYSRERSSQFHTMQPLPVIYNGEGRAKIGDDADNYDLGEFCSFIQCLVVYCVLAFDVHE